MKILRSFFAVPKTGFRCFSKALFCSSYLSSHHLLTKAARDVEQEDEGEIEGQMRGNTTQGKKKKKADRSRWRGGEDVQSRDQTWDPAALRLVGISQEG